jgi:PAS domain-containing protein
MPAQKIELILMRQLADSLSFAVFITDTQGNLLFYNEPAEELLGRRFQETGAMPVEEWSTIFNPVDELNNPMLPEKLPLVKTIMTQRPAHGSFWIESLKGEIHKISVTSMPLVGRPDRFVGAVAFFWKTNEE